MPQKPLQNLTGECVVFEGYEVSLLLLRLTSALLFPVSFRHYDPD